MESSTWLLPKPGALEIICARDNNDQGTCGTRRETRERDDVGVRLTALGWWKARSELVIWG